MEKKRMKKRVLTFVLAVVMIILLIPSTLLSISAQGRYELNYDSNVITGTDILNEARKWKNSGATYWSGINPWQASVCWRTGYTYENQTSFDCSGFVGRVLNDCGIRSTNYTPSYGSCILQSQYGSGYIGISIEELVNYGTDITDAVMLAKKGDYSQLQPGDLIGWTSGALGRHIIIYAGLNNGTPWMVEFTGSGYMDRAVTSAYQAVFQYGARVTKSSNSNEKSIASGGGVRAKLDQFMKSYPDGARWTDSFGGGSQCFGFAKKAVYEVFGKSGNEYRHWNYDASSIIGMTTLGSIASFSATNVKNLLSQAQCGDILQFNTPKQHTMIVYKVDSDGVWIYDCNWQPNCEIDLRKVSFGGWSTRNSTKLTLLRSNNYDEINGVPHAHNPLGNIDGYVGGVHSLHIGGWTFDMDDTNAQLEVRVYLGETYCGSGIANASRIDVNGSYGCGEYHGFEITMGLDKSIVGTQTFSVWAIGVGGGDNTHLGNVTVDIQSDTVGPILYNVNVIEVSPTGYTVSVVPYDSSGIAAVKFPTWTAHNGQDDMLSDWMNNSRADGVKKVDTYTYRVKTSDHNNEYGKYITHIYALDSFGNYTSYGIEVDLSVPDYTYVTQKFGDDFYAYIETVGAGTVLTHDLTGFGNGDYDSIFTAYTKSDTQIWHFIRNDDGSYQISPKSNESLALHVVGGNDKNGENVILHTANKSDAQKWYISKINGAYYFRPACSADCYLDLPDAALHNGPSARIWDFNGTIAQLFYLGDPYSEEIVAEGVYNGYIYRIYDKNMTWTEAQALCEQNGGNLASISSQEEQDFIVSLIKGNGNMNQYWIGARYLDGKYVWSDGTEWGYTNWDNLEPNGIRGGEIYEGFVHIYNAVNSKVEGTEIYKWNDITNGNTLEGEEMFFGLHHVGFVYKAKAKCDACSWNEGVITKRPDCTDPGTVVYTCTVCGETKTDSIPATDHTWDAGVVTTPPSVTDGVKTYTCTVCSETKTESIPATDIPEIDEDAPQIVVSSAKALAGNKVVLTVSIKNNPGVSYLALTLKYDSTVFDSVEIEDGKMFEDLDLGVNLTWSGDEDMTEDGVLCTITLNIADDAPEGTYEINAQFREAYNYDDEEVVFAVVKGSVNVIDFIYGDVNGDAIVNGRDVMLIRKYMSNYDYDTGVSTVEVAEGADANGDGIVNGRDVMLLRKYMANYDYDTGSSTVVLGPQ